MTYNLTVGQVEQLCWTATYRARRSRSWHAASTSGSIGPDRTGRMLEAIAIDDGEVVIHAMKRRKAQKRYLPREDRP